MNVFTIDAENNITVHATRKAARQTGTGYAPKTDDNCYYLPGASARKNVRFENPH